MADRPRLVILTSHPIQYQAPLFRALARDGRLDLAVLFLSRHGVSLRHDRGFGVEFRWDVDLLGGYDSTFLPNLRHHAVPGAALSYLNPGIGRALSRLEPQAILFMGARNPTSLAALAWARHAGIPRLYRAESSALGRRGRRQLLAAQVILRQMSGVLSIGTANDLYYEGLGVPEVLRHLAPYSVDNTFFRERRVSRGTARGQVGILEHEVVLLYAGKLVGWKSPATLIEAAASLEAPVRVMIAGDGPLRPELEALAAARRVPLTVLGFLNQTELPAAYGAADLLVLPSLEEPWGLVVNEAMCMGLPVVVSSRVGARLDLVMGGLTGDVFSAGNAQELGRVLRPLVVSSQVRSELSQGAIRRIARWDIRDTAEGIARALEAHV